jgi:hypothetical protein
LIQFSGLLTPSVVEDIRLLYLRGNAFLRFFFLGVGIFLIGLMLIPRLMNRVPDPSSDRFLLALACFCFLAAAVLHRVWWRWWLAMARPSPDLKVEGAITEEGLNLPKGLTRWKELAGVKVGADAILFYVTKSDFYPVHRTMVQSPEEWHEAQAMAVRYAGRFRYFVEKPIRARLA